MASFTGVSVITGVSLVACGKHCITSPVDADTDSGYHLLVVTDFCRTVKSIPNGESITSGLFMVGGHKWRICYYPNGDRKGSASFIYLSLVLVDEVIEGSVEVNYQFSFVGEVGNLKPVSASFSSKCHEWGIDKFMKRDALVRSGHLKADCFTIRCDIMVCNDLNTQDVGSNIGQHFKNLLQDKVGSDVTFEVSGERFPAHRCVLAARSKVFRAQLFGPMTEGTTSSVIQIKDMEAKVFAALLNFIYTDSFPEMEEDEVQVVQGQEEKAVEVEGEGQKEEGVEVEGEGQEEEGVEVEEEGKEEEAAEPVTWLQWLHNLFVAADIYDIQQLKVLCEKKLSMHIGVSSVASTLALAEQHHCHRLKKVCLKFIQVQSPKRLGKAMATDGWKHISTTYPSILDELIVKLASNQKGKKRKHGSM